MEEIAKVEVRDSGKPIWEARADVETCGDLLEFYGGLAPTIIGMYFSYIWKMLQNAQQICECVKTVCVLSSLPHL